MATPDHTVLARLSVPSDDISTHPPGCSRVSVNTAETLRLDGALTRIPSGFPCFGVLQSPKREAGWRCNAANVVSYQAGTLRLEQRVAN
jgi:hypothetical protein